MHDLFKTNIVNNIINLVKNDKTCDTKYKFQNVITIEADCRKMHLDLKSKMMISDFFFIFF